MRARAPLAVIYARVNAFKNRFTRACIAFSQSQGLYLLNYHYYLINVDSNEFAITDSQIIENMSIEQVYNKTTLWIEKEKAKVIKSNKE